MRRWIPKTIHDVAGGIPRAIAFGVEGGREFSRTDIKAARERHVHTSSENFRKRSSNRRNLKTAGLRICVLTWTDVLKTELIENDDDTIAM